VLERVQSILVYALAKKAKLRLGNGYSMAGNAWLAKGELDKAVNDLEKGTAILRDIGANDYLCFALASLSCAYFESGDFSRAEMLFPETLNLALSQEMNMFLGAVFPPMALLLMRNGAVEKGVELYALACREPYVANSRWYNDVFGRFIAEAAAALSPEVVEAARERGRGLDLWETAERLPQELSEEVRQLGQVS
jgi:tetratricopeptide (TPR) repeat protein